MSEPTLSPATKSAGRPTSSTQLVQAALRGYVRSRLPAEEAAALTDEFSAVVDGLFVQVTTEGWIVTEAEASL